MVVPTATATAKAVITQDTIANARTAVNFLSVDTESDAFLQVVSGHQHPSFRYP